MFDLRTSRGLFEFWRDTDMGCSVRTWLAHRFAKWVSHLSKAYAFICDTAGWGLGGGNVRTSAQLKALADRLIKHK
jgi:hypothetical protein